MFYGKSSITNKKNCDGDEVENKTIAGNELKSENIKQSL